MTAERSTAPDRSDPQPWVAVDACTLPTAAQPLRVAEFKDLFATALRGIDRVSETTLRLALDPAAETAARDLAARESQCCSFFSFEFTTEPDVLRMRIEVPPARIEVLNGLAAQASAARPS